ncbi:MAG: hypothetical protein HWQ38_12195 [Nostoc sp. NMS7]|uniref:hypothetical protein n=1 Tax=Nostoc sp. NMS7 TaxID=2815391 RepID=UPI0025E2E04B|nr:hypothetical protein [Nostoc sp. NMS7]MBN3947186.1 hypothetical protein [Nostoc sp. NMS7]
MVNNTFTKKKGRSNFYRNSSHHWEHLNECRKPKPHPSPLREFGEGAGIFFLLWCSVFAFTEMLPIPFALPPRRPYNVKNSTSLLSAASAASSAKRRGGYPSPPTQGN